MKKIEDFLRELVSKDIKLWMEDGRLLCDAPQGALTPELRTQLKERKQEVIDYLQKANIELDAKQNYIVPFPRNGASIPLSFAQERLWFLNELEGPNYTYNINSVVRITGVLQVEVLERALTEIVRRHEILRTTFKEVYGELVQAIAPPGKWRLIRENWQREKPTASEVEKYIQKSSQVCFDLATGPLFQARILELSSREFVLAIAMHHTISDGWSLEIFLRELSALYQAYSLGKESPLLELQIQYADYAMWQKGQQSKESLESQLSYWQKQLEETKNYRLQLPTDKPRPAMQTFKGRTQVFAINKQLTKQLQKLSLKSGTTQFQTLLAAFATLIYRYSAQANIQIGSPIAGRNRAEIESLIGCFINTLVLITKFNPDDSFAEILKQVREVTLEAYAHQDVPFEQVVNALQPERSLSYSPLFQVLFAWQNADLSELKIPGASLELLIPEAEDAKFDLTLSIGESEGGLIGHWSYNIDIFNNETIARMAANFKILLAGIVENPAGSVRQLPLLTEAEKEQLLVSWNDTSCEYAQNRYIYQLFEEQVKINPNAVAVVFEESQLTYRELNERANQLAHYLRFLGVGPEVLVGLCVERSIKMIVGLLGILKAGGAYVPLDPNYPMERIAYILSNSEAKLLLTEQKLVAYLGENSPRKVCLDTEWKRISQESSFNSKNIAQPDSLAYVIYTSGSTGKPKGVQISHQSLVNFLISMSKEPGLTSSDIICAVTTISFDIAALEIYLPLIVGAKIILVSREVASDGTALLSMLEKSGATVMQGTPATWRMLLSANWSESCQLKMICGGEALTQELSTSLLKKGKSLWNMYGPTETTVWSTVCQVKDFLENESNSELFESIGAAVANTQIYILDDNLQPVPIGVPGELHIGGAGVARGYLNRPDLTSSKFIPNPFSNFPGARLYKTGDTARYLPDGNIEYIGRIDNQVKIRGFRIELGEIEATLVQHPGVLEAAVIAREDIPGDKRLVAYLVGKGKPPTLRELREFLTEKLPGYMVPAAFVLLEAMPLTPNGKLDRRALPLPEKTREELEIGYQAPRIPEETFLCEIYSQLLDVSPVGVNDNFFELGGHSLMAVRLMALIQSKFQAHLPLAILFKYPTVAELARLLTQEADSISWPTLVPVQVKGNQRPLFFVPGAGGNVIYANNLAHCMGSERPFYGLQPQGLDGQTSVDESVASIAQNYIKAIKEVQAAGPYYIAGHSFGGWVAYEMGRQLQRAGEKVGLVLAVDTVPPKERKYKKEKLTEEWQWLEMLMRNAERLYGKEIGVKGEELQKLKTIDAQYEYALNKLIDSGIVPSGAQVRQIKGIMNVYKMNNDIEYIVEEDIEKIPLVLLRAQNFNTEDREIVKEEWYQREDWGWDSYSSIPLKVEWIPGDHHTIMAPPQVETLAEKMLQYIQEAEIEG